MFSKKKKIQHVSDNNLIKYSGWGIPHNIDMTFVKFGGLPTVVAFSENWLAMQEQIVLSMSANKFTEVAHSNTIGCKIPLGTVCY